MSYLVAEIQDPYALAKNNQTTPLRFGSYVKANILGLEISQATSLPRYLVVNDKVAILDAESKLHYVTIDIIRQVGANVIVNNGLAAGDKLIVSALDYPIDGMQLSLGKDSSENVETDVSNTQIASVKD